MRAVVFSVAVACAAHISGCFFTFIGLANSIHIEALLKRVAVIYRGPFCDFFAVNSDEPSNATVTKRIGDGQAIVTVFKAKYQLNVILRFGETAFDCVASRIGECPSDIRKIGIES